MGFLSRIGDAFTNNPLVRKLGGLADDSESAEEQRNNLNAQGGAAAGFADQGQAGYGQLGAEGADARGFLRDQAMGKNSISAEQLRQGLQQQQAQMQSMAQGGPASSAPMMGRTAMIGAGRASSAMAGNAAMAGIAERNAAQQAWNQAILGARGQDLQAALGGRQQAIGAYGGVTPEKSTLDKWGNAITAGMTLAACDERHKTDIADAGAGVDDMLDALSPQSFRYLDEARFGTGQRVGIMAQDLAATAAGRLLVTETPDGLMVDLPKAVVALLATVARLNERIRQLEG